MKKQSNYLQNAKFRIENKKWLNYSSQIALRIIAAMEESEHMTQKALAESIGVSPQYINKVLNGQENLSLQTIAKLSDALNIELISFPKFLFDEPIEYFKVSSFSSTNQVKNFNRFFIIFFISFLILNLITYLIKCYLKK